MTEHTTVITRAEVVPIRISEPGRYYIELAHEGAEAEISGVFRADGKESISVTVIIHHTAPNTRANTVLKGVGRDASSIRFEGRIIIDHGCGQSNSFLTERILLLSDAARAEAVPDLEILTDDVKCSHAASVSRIPEEHIFYLMSRGISRGVAEEMIVAGFLELDSDSA